MKLSKKFQNKEAILPGIILLVAIGLRFYHLFEIPFMHDEFSALFRLNFNTFSDLIDKGVKIDGHPAGIQVFLFYWTKLFGTDEWTVKLPFLVSGVLSVWLIYKIALLYFNRTVALVVMAFIASMQYTIMYSQIARPYASGLFFTLLTVYFWSLLVKKPEKNFLINSVLYILASTLCAYNHYFSLLFVAIVGISGLFFISGKYLKWYVLSGFTIFLLFLPHFKIFMYQLGIGGLGWLGKPDNNFIIEYLKYLFHFSWQVYLLVTLLFLYGGAIKDYKQVNLKQSGLFLAWFFVPFLIGFFYSKYGHPVLQFSVLIFSFPYLLFLLFGRIRVQKEFINYIIVSVILLVNISTLVINREHYKIFYHSVYEGIVTDAESVSDKTAKVLEIVDSHPKITDYYCEKHNLDTGFVRYQQFREKVSFQQFLEAKNDQFDMLYLGALSSFDPVLIPIIKQFYPHVEWSNDYFGGSTYLFSKKGAVDKPLTDLDFEEHNKEWNAIDTSRVTDSVSYSGERSYLYNAETEWGPVYTCKLGDIISNKNDFIDLSVKIKGSALNDVILVASIEDGGESIYWGGVNGKVFPEEEVSRNEWITISHSVKLADSRSTKPNLVLKVLVWNRGRQSFFIDDFKISSRRGNPVLYGLYEDI